MKNSEPARMRFITGGGIESFPALKRKPKSPPKKTPEESLKLPPELEVWFEAIRFEVWPQDRLHQVAVARERFGLHARKFGAVTVYLACRSYLKSHDKVQEGYVQELYTFLGPKKATVLDYLEIAIPYLKDHPSLAALTIPPESEEAFRALIAQDEAAHV